ncbi:MAG: energy-coupling factor transporter transmembrane protein EcfT [Candidatus Fournierella pullistercoris]|uniref:Energy-coupling factor transporter transmembrane protein EcfT n=1 Tax=Candidatus Allofournierella pullistercoris TaxID=2838597 RepID=A0A948T154_9FIRM|nr:energy-coupling factor transporter transmembrane protein EcfT [Candidatus Fournierella pullistercoris]
MSKNAALSYLPRASVVHRLTGTTKLAFFLLWSTAAMLTYDTRLLAAMTVGGLVLFSVSKIRLSEVKGALLFMMLLVVLNLTAIYLFAPDQGTEIYGTKTVWVHLFWRYDITAETMFYLLNFFMKYSAVIPVALLFILATNPSEFAASLAGIGVSYKVGYAVALALRYIPDVQRDFHNISQAQQARGINLSGKDKVLTRLKNSAAILLPLVLASLSRIETVSNAMELRGFGKHKKRSWYMQRPFQNIDWIAMGLGLVVLLISLGLLVVHQSRFFNPFV